MTELLSYPVGRFVPVVAVTAETRAAAIASLTELPRRMRDAIGGLTDRELEVPYRQGGWTVRQVVHHVADSHMSAYTRTKLALTESNPAIKPYDQDAWVALADSALPVEVSLALLEALHLRWVTVWTVLAPEQFARTFAHPELGSQTLDAQLQLYAWHSRHHVAHITALRQREGW